MPTTSSVSLASPTQAAEGGFYVHYDGDDVGHQLGRLIERDGYPTVFEMFRDQPSRFWRHLDADTGQELPEFVTQFPDYARCCLAVPRYGVLFVGPAELQASTQVETVNPATDMDRGYAVNRTGAVRVIR